jgi:hypothetical protein
MKLLFTVVPAIVTAVSGLAAAGEVARVGRWSIVSDKATCTASTMVDGTSLEFELEPTPVLAIQNPRWRIPPGRYPVGLSYLGDKDTEREVTLPSRVTSGQPDRIVIQWERAGDVAALVSVRWLRFRVGPHDFTFPSDASDVAGALPGCAKSHR